MAPAIAAEDIKKVTKLAASDIIVAFMGPTGSGKSNFIDTLTGQIGQRAGSRLESCTTEVRAVRLSTTHPNYGNRLVLVDTPGFDDTNKSDLQILDMISKWLKEVYERDIKLAGIVYLHRITDNRMTGSLHRNLRMFCELCDDQAAKKVVLVTTMWDKMLASGLETRAQHRERDLFDNYWKTIIDLGASTARFDNSSQSAWNIIDTATEQHQEAQGPRGCTAFGMYPPQIPTGVNDGQSSKSPSINYKYSYDSLDTMAECSLEKVKLGKSKKRTTGGMLASLKGAFAKQVKMDDLSRDDIIIAVTGPVGSGKSTFIDTITGLEVGVGHNLESCTSEISTIRLAMPEVAHGDLVFVDTPGFDDTNKSDVDILKMIAEWLKSTYAKGIVLAGLLYFHRITDNRMAGTPLKNLGMFQKLCGKTAFQHVILVTTMWDEIGKEGEEREQELKTKYWQPMLDRGSTTSRFMRTRESAFTLVDPFIETANKRISLLLQQEMVDMGRQLPATSAGRELYSTMEFLVRQRQEIIDRIRNEMKRAEGDKIALEPLQQEHEKLQINLEETVNKMRELKLPLGKRLGNIAVDVAVDIKRFFSLSRTLART